MHKLLTKWLEKHNVKDPEELDNTPMPDGSPTERQVFEEYRSILGKSELTLDDIKEFCNGQITIIERKWADLDTLNDKKAALIPYHTVYKHIIGAIVGTKAMREATERQLELLIK